MMYIKITFHIASPTFKFILVCINNSYLSQINK